ncbi:MAG: O-antigen ligase family protein [bacterium]|nr:O-antigen ligase family protein [bacterium]
MNKILIQKFKGYLQKIDLDKLEKFFFTLFLLSIPFQTRLTFYTPQTYLNGTFNEYATFFLYLSDILLITTLLTFFVNTLTFKNYFGIITKRIHGSPLFIPSTFILITLITWSFINIYWSEYKNIAFYQSVKILEFGLLFLYISRRFKWFGFNNLAALIFVSGFLESLIGIAQYYLQRSLGLRIFMESILSPQIPNVAKIVVDGEKAIRAYGTFPHPNVFAGFLILSIFCGIWLLFSYKTLKAYKIVSRETILYAFLVSGTIAELTAFILTFSRIAWLSSILIIIIFIFLTIRSKLFHACPPMLSIFNPSLTQNNQDKLFHVKQFEILRRWVKQFTGFIFNQRTTLLILSIIIPLLVVISTNWKQINNRTIDNENKYQESTDNRILYNNIAINIIKEFPITGIGGKNFTVIMQKFYNNQLESWQFQPVHNIYLLIASELGLIGLSMFLVFIYLIVKTTWPNSKTVSRVLADANTLKTMLNLSGKNQNVSRETFLMQTGLISVFIGFLFIGLFDHYFWTLQQGQLTFWLTIGLVLSTAKDKINIEY